MYAACCMAMVFILVRVVFMDDSGILSLFSRVLMEGMCVIPLAPAVMTMRGSTFHPRLDISVISGWYFWVLLSMAS